VAPEATVKAMSLMAGFSIPYNLSLGIAITYGLNAVETHAKALTRDVARGYRQVGGMPCQVHW
jgi:hypothetical protein